MTDEPVRMPDFVRKAILAQGKLDPDAIEQAAQTVDLDGAELAEQLRLEEQNEARRAEQAASLSGTAAPRWYDDI